MEDQVMSVRIPKDLAERAKQEATEKDLTLAQIIRRALRSYLSGKTEQAGE